MANRTFADGNNLLRGDAVGEGVKLGLGASREYGWADLRGVHLVATTGTTAPTLELFAAGVYDFGFNVSDIAITKLHLEHVEIPGGLKYLHPHIMMAEGATASGSNLVLTHVVKHSYNVTGAGDTRGLSPAPITIVQTITIAELNAIGSGNSKAFDIEYANTGGTGGKLNSTNMLPDDQLTIVTTITTTPTITGGATAKIAIMPVDVHRQVSDGSGTRFKDRSTGTFWGTNA